jgi:hypothetical protein
MTGLSTTGMTVNVHTSGTISGTYQCVGGNTALLRRPPKHHPPHHPTHYPDHEHPTHERAPESGIGETAPSHHPLTHHPTHEPVS